MLTLMLSIAAGAFTIFGILRAKTALLVCGLISAALITLISGYDITNVNSVASGPFGLEPDVGGGLYLTLAGRIAGMLGAALALKDAR